MRSALAHAPESAPARSGADYLLEALAEAGVDTIFGYPGGAVLPLYDALERQDRIRHILVRHEQAAVHAAEGYARSTGRLGVVLVTSGPGATNTLTGLCDALMDSVPVLCIAGQVGSHLLGTEAFQEANMLAMSRPATKWNGLVRRPAQLLPMLRHALALTRHGRPGPVFLEITKDVQALDGPGAWFEGEGVPLTVPTLRPPDMDAVAKAARLLSGARRPLIYSGGGVVNSGPDASMLLRRLASLTAAPVTSTLMGLGAFPARDPQWLGMPGMHGTYEANLAMHDCDVMLCVGARFDDRVTGRLDGFSPRSRKIHIDIDPSQIGRLVDVEVGIVGDVARVLEMLCEALEPGLSLDLDDWWTRIEGWRRTGGLNVAPSMGEISPQHAISRLWQLARDHDPIICTEVGQHQMWAAQFCGFQEPNRWLTSGGLGTMGYGLPAAIGAQVAYPRKLVIDIAGEASIQMNIQELATAAQYGLPVKLFIVNNGCLGMVRQWQQLHYEGRYAESTRAVQPDFVALARAYGWEALKIEDPADLDSGILEMIRSSGPCLVDCRVKPLENCFPMVPSGAAHNEVRLS